MKLTSSLAQLLNRFPNRPSVVLFDSFLLIHLIYTLIVQTLVAVESVGVSEAKHDSRRDCAHAYHERDAPSYLISVLSLHLPWTRRERTHQSYHSTSSKTTHRLVIRILFLSQIACRVSRELVCGTHGSCTQLAQPEFSFVGLTGTHRR